jgi:hypothetical protein
VQILPLIPILAGEAQQRRHEHDAEEREGDCMRANPLDERGAI